MSTEDNKVVVRRFMHELLAGGDLSVADEVLAPDYVKTQPHRSTASLVWRAATDVSPGPGDRGYPGVLVIER